MRNAPLAAKVCVTSWPLSLRFMATKSERCMPLTALVAVSTSKTISLSSLVMDFGAAVVPAGRPMRLTSARPSKGVFWSSVQRSFTGVPTMVLVCVILPDTKAGATSRSASWVEA